MATKKKPTENPFVIVRGRLSGVICGYLESRTTDAIVLTEARQVWRWRGANTVTDLARTGASLTEFTRIAEPAPRVEIQTADVGAVVYCTQEAQANLRQSRWLS